MCWQLWDLYLGHDMTYTYYTIEIGAFELWSEYPCYWVDDSTGQFSNVKDAITAAQGLECEWWRVVKHVETETVAAKSPKYIECCVE